MTDPKRHFYVRVSEHYVTSEFIPFSANRPRKPGTVISWRVYGPYTYKGAQRIAKTALDNVGEIQTIHRIAHKAGDLNFAVYQDDQTFCRVSSIYPYNPDQGRFKPIRRFPKGA